MKSRPYRGIDVKHVSVEQLARENEGSCCDVGLDTSKSEIRVVIRWSSERFERPWVVKLPELGILVEKLKRLSEIRETTIAMEPTGTYGDPVRQALHDAGLMVYRVSPKASHDYAEILDGVPSQHDGKDAACVAELSAIKKRDLWIWEASSQSLRYEIDWIDGHQQTLTRWLGRLEGLLGRLWPEVSDMLKLSSRALLKMLEHYGSPKNVAADPEAAERLKKWSNGKLSPKKIDELLRSARATVAVRSASADILQVQRYARAALASRREVSASKKRLKELTKGNEVIARQAAVVGHGAAAVLWGHMGTPSNYHCGNAYRKGMGLNLKERSSGRWKGQIKITKRGPSQVRRWLYFAALRLCQNSWIRPWYKAKKKRGKGYAKRALVTLMRKLALALYYVGKGEMYDVHRLVPGAARYHKKKKKTRR